MEKTIMNTKLEENMSMHSIKMIQLMKIYQEKNSNRISKKDLTVLLWLLDRLTLYYGYGVSFTEGDYTLDTVTNTLRNTMLELLWEKEYKEYFTIDGNDLIIDSKEEIDYDYLSDMDNMIIERWLHIVENNPIKNIEKSMISSPEYISMLRNNTGRLSKIDFFIEYPDIYDNIFVIENNLREALFALFIHHQAVTHSIRGESEMLLEEFDGLEEYYLE